MHNLDCATPIHAAAGTSSFEQARPRRWRPRLATGMSIYTTAAIDSLEEKVQNPFALRPCERSQINVRVSTAVRHRYADSTVDVTTTTSSVRCCGC